MWLNICSFLSFFFLLHHDQCVTVAKEPTIVHPKSSFTIPPNKSYHDYHSWQKCDNQKVTDSNEIDTNTGSQTQNPLIVEPKILNGYKDWINISWNFSDDLPSHSTDWIGVFNASSNIDIAYASPPITFFYICPMYNNCTTPPYNGSIRVELLNRRTDYVILYVNSQDINYREIRSTSDIITFNNLYIPMNVHLSFISSSNPKQTTDTKTVQIMWTQKNIHKPKVQYGLLNRTSSLVHQVDATLKHSFDENNLCDQRYSMPAGLYGYLERHYSVSAFIHDLRPNTKIFYRVGEDKYGWSEIYNFTTPPVDGGLIVDGDKDDESIKFVIIGDGGNVPLNYGLHHSFDFNDHGEIYSVNVTNMIGDNYLNGPLDESHFLVHVGDLSYSDGYLSEWDDWFHQIHKIAPYIPFVTGIGNHEYSWHGEWIPPSKYVNPSSYADGDSFGECGVVYHHYFPFAMNNPIKSYINGYNPQIVDPWYYFDYGMIRLIFISTEHDYSKYSKQWFWIQNMLKNTDRATFPWLIVVLHRPMYSNSFNEDDFKLSSYIRLNLESLFKKYKVSFTLSGHEHLYSRTCPVYNQTCHKKTKHGISSSMVNVVAGMSGHKLIKHAPNTNLSYLAYGDNTHHGFVHFSIINKSVAYGKFVDALTGDIVDEFHIKNPYRRGWSSLMML